MNKVSRRPTLLTLAALAALATLLGYTGISFGAIVLGAGSSALTQSGPATPTTVTQPGYKNSHASVTDANGAGSGYAFSSDTGAYAVNASATGKASGTANASFLTTVVNNNAFAQAYSLSFHVYGGFLQTALNSGATLTGLENLVASYAASVKVNNSAVFTSAATLTRNLANGITLAQSGTVLSGATLSGGYYSWGNDYYTVNLGTVAAGDSIDVLAEVSDSAYADVGTHGVGVGGNCGNINPTGGGLASAVGAFPPECFKGTARAWYGDPLAIAGLPGSPPASGPGFAIAQIPEPASLALTLLALGAAGATSCRRKTAG